MTPINWPDGWTPHADRDASGHSMRERAERAESVARGQQKLIEAQRARLDRVRALAGSMAGDRRLTVAAQTILATLDEDPAPEVTSD